MANTSLATRLFLVLTACIAAALSLSTFIDYQWARKDILAQVEQHTETTIIDTINTLDAQRTRLSAESSCAMSEAMIVTNVVRLYKALGGGWENVPPLPEGEAPGDADG